MVRFMSRIKFIMNDIVNVVLNNWIVFDFSFFRIFISNKHYVWVLRFSFDVSYNFIKIFLLMSIIIWINLIFIYGVHDTISTFRLRQILIDLTSIWIWIEIKFCHFLWAYLTIARIILIFIKIWSTSVKLLIIITFI